MVIFCANGTEPRHPRPARTANRAKHKEKRKVKTKTIEKTMTALAAALALAATTAQVSAIPFGWKFAAPDSPFYGTIPEYFASVFNTGSSFQNATLYVIFNPTSALAEISQDYQNNLAFLQNNPFDGDGNLDEDGITGIVSGKNLALYTFNEQSSDIPFVLHFNLYLLIVDGGDWFLTEIKGGFSIFDSTPFLGGSSGWLTNVPEPATGALALAGVALLFRRKRK